MILRSFCRLPTVLLAVLLLFVPSSLAEDSKPFDCRVNVNDTKFDLTPLAGAHKVNRTRVTFPTTTIDILRFDLCDDLKQLADVPTSDQCPTGTRACLTMVNQKKEEADRVVSVIPLTRTESLNPSFNFGLSSPRFISIIFTGPQYPHPINSTPTAQSLNVTLFCNSEVDSEPAFKSYSGAQVQVEWSTKYGCPVQADSDGPKEGSDDKGSNEPSGTTGSGIGWFFLVLLLAFAAYFILGAYYNYSNYGASGADLIPHRDFWKEVPYMLNDVVSHLCSSVRPRRSSRGGYIAV